MTGEFKGELFGLTTAFCWTIGSIYFAQAAQRLGANVLNHFRLALAAILLAVSILIFERISPVELFTLPALNSWIWLGFSGILGLTIGDWCAFKAFEILGARKTSLFYTFSPGAALLFGLLFLNETISYIAFAGIIVTVAGVFWVIFTKRNQEEVLHPQKQFQGAVYAMTGAITQGMGLVFSKIGMNDQGLGHHFSPLHATWMRIFAAILSLLILSILRNKLISLIRPILHADPIAIRFTLLATVISPVIGVSCSLYAASLINVSIAQTFFSLVPVLILPVSYLLYRERISRQSWLGALIAVAGVLLLVWRDELAVQISSVIS